MSNRAAIFLKRARAVARRCRSAGLPNPFTVNGAGSLVVNPAVSEAQRRYLNAAFGHGWVKDHGFDNHGKLPDRVSDETLQENDRRMAGTCTANESNFFGRFFRWLTNAKPAQTRDMAGQFSSVDDDADDKEAAEKGVSVEELRRHREAGDEIRPVKNRRRVLVANAKRCPECGGKMDGGECDECDYVENVWSDAARAAASAARASGSSGRQTGPYGFERTDLSAGSQRQATYSAASTAESGSGTTFRDDLDPRRTPEEDDDDSTENAQDLNAVDDEDGARDIQPRGGDSRPDGRHNSRLTKRRPIDLVDDDGDPYLDEDDHSDLVRQDQIAATQNVWSGPDPHDSTKQAVASTVMSEHTGARDHAMGAMDASAGDDSSGAAGLHLKAAKVHEDAATGARGDGEHGEADNHDQAAALHRKAASMHRASMSFNQWFATNMPAGGAFSGAKAAGFSPAQAAAMAGKLEGSYHGGEEHHPLSTAAKKASEHAEKSKSKSAHRRAAGAHKEAAEHHSDEGHSEMAAAHASAARSHAAKAARMTRNEGGTMNWRALLGNDPLITNMPAGGAFSGAKAAGFSPAQAAAMAGKLEGSYHSGSAKAEKASAHADRTKSKSAHRKAAAAHRAAASDHAATVRAHPAERASGEKAAYHGKKARYHSAKAGKATRNELVEIIQNCADPGTQQALMAWLVTNEPSATGEEGGELFAGRDEEDDEPGIGEDDDDDGIPEKVRLKKHQVPTGNAYLAHLPPDIRETITEARTVVNREKQALVQRLVQNIRSPERRDYRTQQLMQRDLPELRGMLELVGNSGPREQPMTSNEVYPLPVYGADDASIISNSGGADGEDVLDCPTINFTRQTG